jgi:hypothetical protein
MLQLVKDHQLTPCKLNHTKFLPFFFATLAIGKTVELDSSLGSWRRHSFAASLLRFLQGRLFRLGLLLSF